jgi:NitT/TauT family transport system substrate-binding protein
MRPVHVASVRRSQGGLGLVKASLLALTLALFLAACGSGGDTAETPTESDSETASSETETPERASIKVAPVSPSPILWAHVWLAEALGYYDEEELDVEIISNLSGGAVENALILGDLDFGASNQARLIPIIAKEGKSVLKMFAPESNYLFRIVVLDDSPIRTAQDLIGKTIGINEPGGDEDTVKLLTSLEGIKEDQYKTLAVGGRATAGVALNRKQVDAYSGSFADQDAIERSGVKVRVIEVGDTSEFYNSGITATPETLEERRDVAVRYGRALAKAMIWKHENPEAAIELLGEIVPEAVQDREDSLALLKASNANDRSMYQARMDTEPEVWEKMVQALLTAGVIENEVEVDDFLTEDLIDDIWDFDVDAVVEAAKADERP